ncbi:acetolactate synthase 2 small subunit [Alkalimarinus alittae]|uniref:Acetolactate synthase 2 small subunit n=1 Tax=Alkalimarinus alittae TaxID=2961619 RepID=A0ABY6N1U9_9ALTE|nr:acetolactate synthase 2 small subunit [Alkalimarinus alittae]UZE96088.1 acetolactate synthase 2 small subunit [Alkalimarinus alittae]
MSQIAYNQTTIQFSVENTPAILERLLRTIRVRGFALDNMVMKSNDQLMEIELSVSGERSISMLINQLTKLVGVKDICSLDKSTRERMSA